MSDHLRGPIMSLNLLIKRRNIILGVKFLKRSPCHWTHSPNPFLGRLIWNSGWSNVHLLPRDRNHPVRFRRSRRRTVSTSRSPSWDPPPQGLGSGRRRTGGPSFGLVTRSVDVRISILSIKTRNFSASQVPSRSVCSLSLGVRRPPVPTHYRRQPFTTTKVT